MAILTIRMFGDPVLRQPSRPVGRVTEMHVRLAQDMLDTMRDAPGVGLAGNQVGVIERIFVYEVEEQSGCIIDPTIVDRSDEDIEGEEGCLSLPGLLYPVTRSERVVVEGVDEHGSPVHLEADGLLARVCQHEIDHLDGILFIDRLPEDLRKDALRTLREQALGITRPAPVPVEEKL